MTGANGSGQNFDPTRSIGASRSSNARSWTIAATSAPQPIRVTASCATTQRLRLRDRLDEAVLVERQQRARIPDLDGDPVGLGFRRRFQRLVDESSGGDDGDVFALAVQPADPELERLDLLRHLALDRVEQPVLEEEHRVVVVDRAPEQVACVDRRGRERDLQTGHVDEPRLELLRVLCSGRPARTTLGPDRQRDLELAAGHVPVLGGLVHDLLHRESREVLVHDLDDRAHALHGRADTRAHDRHLRDRGVAHTLGAELLQHALGDAHRAAHLGDVLAHDEDVRVAPHGLDHDVPDRLAIRRLRHLTLLGRRGAGLRPAGATGGEEVRHRRS